MVPSCGFAVIARQLDLKNDRPAARSTAARSTAACVSAARIGVGARNDVGGVGAVFGGP